MAIPAMAVPAAGRTEVATQGEAEASGIAEKPRAELLVERISPNEEFRAGREYDVAYRYTGTFDTIVVEAWPPSVECLSGPSRFNGSETIIANGERQSFSYKGVRYRIRLKRSGTLSLPGAVVHAGPLQTAIPPRPIRIRPAAVNPLPQCRFAIQPQKPAAGVPFHITLRFSARPDQQSPVLVADGMACTPSKSSSVSIRHDDADCYEFHFQASASRPGRYIIRGQGLSFDGAPYPLRIPVTVVPGEEVRPVGNGGPGKSLLPSAIKILAMGVVAWALWSRRRIRRPPESDAEAPTGEDQAVGIDPEQAQRIDKPRT